ncbi:MAG: serine dehydratase beta chain, partial [Thermovirgaceae bacterium]
MAVLKVPGSIFDILGPVMTGPSSSHTAGAVRIGLMARGIAGGSPKKAVITFYGSLAETYKGHMTDSGVVAGLLGMGVDDPGIKEALESAKKKGISIQVLALPSETKNPNTIVVELETPEGRAYRVEGVTVGGGEIQISSIDNFLVDLRGKHDEVLLFTGPGTALPDEAKAIASGREPSVLEGPGGARLFVIRPFASPERSVLEGLGKANGVLGVSFLPRLYDYGKADGPALFSTVEGMVRLSGEIGLLPALENYEAGRSGLSREEAREKLARAWSVMEGSTKAGLSGRNKMVGGFMPGDDGRRLLDALNSGVTLSGPVLPLAVAKAISAMEVNASMGRV